MYQVGRVLFPDTQAANVQEAQCMTPYPGNDVVTAYLSMLHDNAMIAEEVVYKQMRDKFLRRLSQLGRRWASNLGLCHDSYRDFFMENMKLPSIDLAHVDLSIVIPIYNVAEFLEETLTSLYKVLRQSGISFEVFAINDGSTDDADVVLSKFAATHPPNFYFVSNSVPTGPGKARNVALRLIEGRYVYFLDSDDRYDFSALADAVKFATANNVDLLLLPYHLEYVLKNRKVKQMPMYEPDARIWAMVRNHSNWTHANLVSAALALIGYPWKQLTLSKLLFDNDIFFGITKVHNDVQFHWTSIASSRNIHFFSTAVCFHRKYDAAIRTQVSRAGNQDRMQVFDALEVTQRALGKLDIFDGDIRRKWYRFCNNLFDWAAARIPSEKREEFNHRQQQFFKTK
jgi:glycosyltransferase involved in cell wall biosynthesis